VPGVVAPASKRCDSFDRIWILGFRFRVSGVRSDFSAEWNDAEWLIGIMEWWNIGIVNGTPKIPV
jgi:hypothetical protein